MRFHIANEIPMSAKDLWEAVHTPAFCAFLAREYGLTQRELEREIHDRWMHRRIRTVAARDLPHCISSVVAALLGTNEIAYDEIQEKALDAFEMVWRIESPVLKDKIHCSGTLRLTPIDGGHCLRTIEGEVHVKLFAVGQACEKIISREIRNTSNKLAEAVAGWKARTTEQSRRHVAVPARTLESCNLAD